MLDLLISSLSINMLIPWDIAVFAVLDSGRSCKWIRQSYVPTRETDSPISIIDISVKKAITCPASEMLLVQTHDHRFYLGTAGYKDLKDITTQVASLLQIEPDDIGDLVEEICTDKLNWIVRTRNQIWIICLEGFNSRHEELPSRIEYSIPGPIDLFSYGYYHGLVRTTDNRLFLIGNESYCSYRLLDRSRTIQPTEISFSDASNIKQVVCGDNYTLCLMNDGKVYAHGLRFRSPHRTNTFIEEQFEAVVFPEGTVITKIVSSEACIIYLTDSGHCYHTGIRTIHASIESHCIYRNGIIEETKENLCPDLLQQVRHLVVEDVFMLNTSIVIQDSYQRLHVLDLDVKDLFWGDSWVIGAKTCEHIPFFDDKDIVSIVQSRRTKFIRPDITGEELIYLTTDSGEAYQSADLRQGATEITFFTDNPLARLDRSAAIPSAKSIVKH